MTWCNKKDNANWRSTLLEALIVKTQANEDNMCLLFHPRCSCCLLCWANLLPNPRVRAWLPICLLFQCRVWWCGCCHFSLRRGTMGCKTLVASEASVQFTKTRKEQTHVVAQLNTFLQEFLLLIFPVAKGLCCHSCVWMSKMTCVTHAPKSCAKRLLWLSSESGASDVTPRGATVDAVGAWQQEKDIAHWRQAHLPHDCLLWSPKELVLQCFCEWQLEISCQNDSSTNVEGGQCHLGHPRPMLAWGKSCQLTAKNALFAKPFGACKSF